MTEKQKIRDVNTLEELRVKLSDQIKELEAKGETVADLNQIKKLKVELGDIKSELAISKNIEARKETEHHLQQIKDAEKENHEHYEAYIALARQAVPLLEKLVELLPQANREDLNAKSREETAIMLKQQYNSRYGEELQELKLYRARGVPDYNIAYLLEWMKSDLSRAEAREAKATEQTNAEEGNEDSAS